MESIKNSEGSSGRIGRSGVYPLRVSLDKPKDSWREWLLHDTGYRERLFCEALACKCKDQHQTWPWVTLVLGAEILAPELPSNAVDMAIDAISIGLKDLNSSEVSIERAKKFICELFNGRSDMDFAKINNEGLNGMSILANCDSSDNSPISYNEWILLFIEAVACLNEIYFITKAGFNMPINRWEISPVSLGRPSKSAALSNRWEECNKVLTNALQAMTADVDKMRTQNDNSTSNIVLRRDLSAIINLVGYVQGKLSEDHTRSIEADKLLTLTEMAWHLITRELIASRGVDQYLSWAETLLALGLSDLSDGAKSGIRPRSSNPDVVHNRLFHELNRPTEKSAKKWFCSCVAEGNTSMSHFDMEIESNYRAYARILHGQAALCHKRQFGLKSKLKNSSGNTRVKNMPPGHRNSDVESVSVNLNAPSPLATAFVTTFDLELELAYRNIYPDSDFVVALPVNVAVGDENHGVTIWLGYRVKARTRVENASQILRAVARSTGDFSSSLKTDGDLSSWFVLSQSEEKRKDNHYDISSTVFRDALESGPVPIIVRLTGSPLVALPLIKNTDKSPDAQRLLREIEHSVGCNDALFFDTKKKSLKISHALVVEEAHSLFMTFPEFDRNSYRGLPQRIANYFPEGYWRFWTLIGVQASDDPIRYRLISQIAVPSEVLDRDLGNPDRAGVAVSRGGDLLPAVDSLLKWSNFDVVKNDVKALRESLDHYADHLEAVLEQPDGDHGLTDDNDECSFKKEN